MRARGLTNIADQTCELNPEEFDFELEPEAETSSL